MFNKHGVEAKTIKNTPAEIAYKCTLYIVNIISIYPYVSHKAKEKKLKAKEVVGLS